MSKVNKRIDCLHDKTDGYVDIVVPKSMVPEFQQMAQRAINTWQDPSPEMRDFIDRLLQRNVVYYNKDHPPAPSFIGEVTDHKRLNEVVFVPMDMAAKMGNEALHALSDAKTVDHYVAMANATIGGTVAHDRLHYDPMSNRTARADDPNTRKAISMMASITSMMFSMGYDITVGESDFLVGMEHLIYLKHGRVNDELLAGLQGLYDKIKEGKNG